VSVEDTIKTLRDSSDSAIAQVGLIANNTGKIKSWKASKPAFVQEGGRVRMRGLKKNWYQWRCSLAVTYDSMTVFPVRDDRPADGVERADAALAALAAQELSVGTATEVYIYTTDIAAGEGAETVLTSEGYGDSVTFVNGFRFIEELRSTGH